MQETWVQSLGWQDPLEKEVAAHASSLDWEILWTEEPGGLQSQRVGHDLVTRTHTQTNTHVYVCLYMCMKYVQHLKIYVLVVSQGQEKVFLYNSQ